MMSPWRWAVKLTVPFTLFSLLQPSAGLVNHYINIRGCAEETVRLDCGNPSLTLLIDDGMIWVRTSRDDCQRSMINCTRHEMSNPFLQQVQAACNGLVRCSFRVPALWLQECAMQSNLVNMRAQCKSNLTTSAPSTTTATTTTTTTTTTTPPPTTPPTTLPTTPTTTSTTEGPDSAGVAVAVQDSTIPVWVWVLVTIAAMLFLLAVILGAIALCYRKKLFNYFAKRRVRAKLQHSPSFGFNSLFTDNEVAFAESLSGVEEITQPSQNSQESPDSSQVLSTSSSSSPPTYLPQTLSASPTKSPTPNPSPDLLTFSASSAAPKPSQNLSTYSANYSAASPTRVVPPAYAHSPCSSVSSASLVPHFQQESTRF